MNKSTFKTIALTITGLTLTLTGGISLHYFKHSGIGNAMEILLLAILVCGVCLLFAVLLKPQPKNEGSSHTSSKTDVADDDSFGQVDFNSARVHLFEGSNWY